MKRTNLFSGAKPATEDWNFERDAKELHIKKRIVDLTGTGTGILKNVDNGIQVYVDDPNQYLIVKVKTGQAYIQGEKIEITSVQDVSLDSVQTEANIVYLTYQLKNSTDEQAIRHHYLTGQEYNVWQEDSFELYAVKESNYVQTDDKLKLARVDVIASVLTITHDYRTYLKISDDIMNTLIEGQEILFKQPAPPVPTRVRLTTDFEEELRKNELAGLISVRPAYIKAEFGDWGTGTASGNTFTKTSSQLTWTTNEWAGQYLTDQNNDSYLVVSNTTDTLTLEPGVTPVSGNFWLGPDARGYRFIIEPLDPDTEIPISKSQAEMTFKASPVEMQYIFHGLTPDIKYQVRVASLGGWYQEEQSDFCTPITITAGGPKQIPESCADAVENVVVVAHDLGIKVTWDIVATYTEHVAGFELVWTDDGSTPDFANIGHRKTFVDRNFAILPATLSTSESTITVKAKMRCIDKTGRHCTTPLSISPVNMKQYVGDLADIVSEIVSARGEYGDLQERIEAGITEVGEEVASGRLGYSSIGKAIEAITRSSIAWKYVRIVAKEGGHYSSIQAAIDSIIEYDKYYIIYIMPGKYIESIDCKDKLISLIGLGKVLIDGRVDGKSGLNFFDNIRIKPASASNIPALKIALDTTDKRFLMQRTIVDATNISTGGNGVLQIIGRFGIKNCTIYCPNVVDGIGLIGMTIPSLGAIEACKINVGQYPVHVNASSNATIKECLLKAGSTNASVNVLGTARIYNCVWNNAPSGAGTIDFGSAVNESNILNSNIEIILEDDMLSNET